MGRRYDDPIEVRTTQSVGSSGGAVDGAADAWNGLAVPVAFLWRDRLYVVQEVLGHWYERRMWWRETAASALLGLRSDVDVAAQGAATSGGGDRTATALALETPPAPRSPTEPAEREVWRVEAAAGRSSPVGVYDLVHDPGPGTPQTDTWRLVRLDD